MSETPPESPAPEQDQPDQPEHKPAEQPEQPDKPDSPEETDDGGKDDGWDPERAKAKIRKVNSENKALRERATAAEKKAEGVDEKDRRITDLGSENLRLRVGYELGLPIDMVDRLRGETKEELVADAEKLVELIAPTKRPTTRKPSEALRGGTQPEQEPEETDVRKLGERMFSR